MVGQAHLIPQRSASLHVLAQPHLGRQLAARPALLQEDLLAARCRRGVEEVVVAKVFCLPGRKARACGPAQDGWARERAAESSELRRLYSLLAGSNSRVPIDRCQAPKTSSAWWSSCEYRQWGGKCASNCAAACGTRIFDSFFAALLDLLEVGAAELEAEARRARLERQRIQDRRKALI